MGVGKDSVASAGAFVQTKEAEARETERGGQRQSHRARKPPTLRPECALFPPGNHTSLTR